MTRTNGQATPSELPPRPLAYQLLSQGLTYPDSNWIDGLPAWQEALRLILTPLIPTEEGVFAALLALPENPAQALQHLQIEHTRLFINAVPHVLAPPYASAYSDQGLLMGQPAEAALQAYRRAGLAFTAADHALPDHLAAELEFMAFLSQEYQAAQMAGDETLAGLRYSQQRDFLSNQLLSWVPAWAQRVQEGDRIGFYRALATLTLGWLQFDANYLAHFTP